VMVIYSATKGYADDVRVADISRFNTELRTYLNVNYPQIGQDIVSTKDLGPATEASLRAAIEAFKETWVAQEGTN
jgi:F-type H+/Na+-transporting ATPase subunit alpha